MKSQAETAGRLSSKTTRPQKGTVLRDVELALADGTHALLSKLRGHSNVVMLFNAGRDVDFLLKKLMGRVQDLKEQNARVLMFATAVAGLPEHTGGPLPSLFICAIDPQLELHRLLGATDISHNPVPTIYVTDRFGEVFAAFHYANPQFLPGADEIIRWLEFINFQCEECSPPEWPE